MTKKQVDECRKLHLEGTDIKELMARYGVSKTTIKVVLGLVDKDEHVRDGWAKEWEETRMAIKSRINPAGLIKEEWDTTTKELRGLLKTRKTA